LRQGTLGRNALRAFGFWQVDFALRRQFKFKESLGLEFKVELLNAFNHPNFGNPDKALDRTTFGRSTRMLGSSLGSAGLNPIFQIGGPRSIQLSIKLSF